MTIISMPYLVHVMMRQMDDCSVRGWRHGCGRHIGSPEDGSLLDMEESVGIVIFFECFRLKFENFTKVTMRSDHHFSS